MVNKTYTIDASGKILGRLAAEIAVLLRGKNMPGYLPYKDEGALVIVKNVDKIVISGKKMENKSYYRHSGYPSGLKKISMKSVFKKRPAEVLKRAIFGMLPKNKLREKQIKRLKFE